jgi:ferredoxin-NADP reductase
MTSYFQLVTKRSLTRDVWELDFRVVADPTTIAGDATASQSTLLSSPLSVAPGQYILFVLPSWLRRAYSIGYSFQASASYASQYLVTPTTQIFRFVIKRLDHAWAGSQEVCDISVGWTLKGMWPIWHFILPTTPQDTLFIGTGTGFAPLYYQMRSLCEAWAEQRLHFVFGVRSEADIFYHSEIADMMEGRPNLSFTQYLSKPDVGSQYLQGYVTDYLTPENIAQYQTFSICGSPAMVKNAREILENIWIHKDQIRFEQY